MESKTKAGRLSFIDVLRGLAVLWMIETHMVDMCLAPRFKTGSLYGWLNLSNGFVAVTFIFCAGAGFWLGLEKKADDYLRFGASFWKTLRRLGFIGLVAYAIHTPRFSLRASLHVDPASMHHWATSDVLQMIVVSSLAALLLFFIIRRKDVFKYAALLVTFLIFAVTPLIWGSDPFLKLPYAIATYFSKPPVSNFPLFPWMGYFFAGIAATAFIKSFRWPWAFALGLLVVGYFLKPIVFYIKDLPFSYPGHQDWWYSSPGHAVYRLSRVVMAFSALFLLEKHLDLLKPVKNFFVILGQESLLVYFWHIVIIYGTSANRGLRTYLPGALNPWQTALGTALIAGLLFLFAFQWNRLKKNSPRTAQWTLALITGSALLLFLILK